MGQTTFSGPVVSNNGFIANSFTTTERNALTPVTGLLIYNTTEDEYQVYGNSDWQPAFGSPAPVEVTYTRGVDYGVSGGLQVLTMGATTMNTSDADWTNTAGLATLVAQPSGTAYTFDRSGTTYTFTTTGAWTSGAGTHEVNGNITGGSGPFPGGPPYSLPAVTFTPA